MHGKVKKMIAEYMKGKGMKEDIEDYQEIRKKKSKNKIKQETIKTNKAKKVVKGTKTYESNKELRDLGIMNPRGRPVFNDDVYDGSLQELHEMEEDELRQYHYEQMQKDKSVEQIKASKEYQKQNQLVKHPEYKLNVPLPRQNLSHESKLWKKMIQDEEQREKNRNKNLPLALLKPKEKGADFNKKQNDEAELYKIYNQLKGKFKARDNENDDYDNIEIEDIDVEPSLRYNPEARLISKQKAQEEIKRVKANYSNEEHLKERYRQQAKQEEKIIESRQVAPKIAHLNKIEMFKEESKKLNKPNKVDFSVHIKEQRQPPKDDSERISYINAIRKRRDELASMNDKQLTKLRKSFK